MMCPNFNAQIQMYFGHRASGEHKAILDSRAAEREIPLQCILLEEFELVFNMMLEKGVIAYEGKVFSMNLFDSHCVIHADIEGVFFSPPVQLGRYSHNGSIYPKLIFQDGYMRNQENMKAFPLTDTLANKLGHEYEKFFQFAFMGFERI